MAAQTTVLAPDLQVGDLLIESGIGGVSGVVVRVTRAPTYVGVWLADGTAHSLGLLEACDVERELRVEAA
jgi:hypothetical protein